MYNFYCYNLNSLTYICILLCFPMHLSEYGMCRLSSIFKDSLLMCWYSFEFCTSLYHHHLFSCFPKCLLEVLQNLDTGTMKCDFTVMHTPLWQIRSEGSCVGSKNVYNTQIMLNSYCLPWGGTYRAISLRRFYFFLPSSSIISPSSTSDLSILRIF